jgi:type I restriction enzyme M protein
MGILKKIQVRPKKRLKNPYIFWLIDESLVKSNSLPEPQIIAREIVNNLESVLERFEEIEIGLKDK